MDSNFDDDDDSHGGAAPFDAGRFEQLKAERIRDLEASVAFFGQENKTQRECDLVDDLVRNLNESFDPSEIEPVLGREEFPDVKFRGANFEIKEIIDRERRRHDEYRAALDAVRRATTYDELYPVTLFQPSDTTVTEVCAEVTAIGARLKETKYAEATIRRTDLLIYYNRLNVFGLEETPFPLAHELQQQGWRSVAVVMGHKAIVFVASDMAPDFLQRSVGRVFHRDVAPNGSDHRGE